MPPEVSFAALPANLCRGDALHTDSTNCGEHHWQAGVYLACRFWLLSLVLQPFGLSVTPLDPYCRFCAPDTPILLPYPRYHHSLLPGTSEGAAMASGPAFQ